MGLFDGGFDMDALAQMLNPISGAQAAPMQPDFADRFGAAFPNAAAPDLANPNPVQPGTIPMPRPNPLQPTPEQLAGATRLGLPGPRDADVGAALTQPAIGPTSVGGAPLGPPPTPPEGGGSSTDVSARARNPAEARPSLAQALKGVQAPAAPVLQKISSPNAPRPTGTIKGGDLQALLLALNAGVPALTGRQLPVTLGRG
jgi:hypothetical protein